MKIKEITKMGWIGMLLLLPSCEKDVLGPDTGVGVPIEFSMSSAGYDEGDEVRSFGTVEPETKVIPLGEDNLYLYATLREEPAEALRAEVGLQPNQKVQLAAYKGTDQQGSTLTYTYSGGKLTPDGGVRLKVEPDNSNYTFVAYSYYGDPTTAVSSLTDIDPGKDLVWGSKAQSVTTTESTQKVSIKMTHRFAQVRVKIDASTIATAITDIGTVTVTGGKTANLTEETGDVAPTSTNANQTVDFPSSTSNVRTSDYCTYWQAITGVSISSITLTIASVAKTFTGLTAYFSKTLEAGKSYTLEVDLKRIIFAGSNIYWDAGNDRLTFDESTNSNYQGVYFQWGSLVGLSAMGVVNNDMRLYIPNVSDGTWDGTKTIGSSSWANYSSLPHIESVYGTGAADNYLYDHPNFENYKGDICAYLTGKAGTPAGSWRLPNAEEYSMIVSHEKVTGSISGQNEAGTGTMTAGIDFGTGIFFPCVGFRNAISTPDVTGTSGFYTSGTPFGTDASNTWFRYYFDINAISNVIGVYNYAYIDGMSVRCLKI